MTLLSPRWQGPWRLAAHDEVDSADTPAVLHTKSGRAAWGRYHAQAYERLGFQLVDEDRYSTIDDIPDGELVSGWITENDRFYDGAGHIWAGELQWVNKS